MNPIQNQVTFQITHDEYIKYYEDIKGDTFKTYQAFGNEWFITHIQVNGAESGFASVYDPEYEEIYDKYNLLIKERMEELQRSFLSSEPILFNIDRSELHSAVLDDPYLKHLNKQFVYFLQTRTYCGLFIQEVK